MKKSSKGLAVIGLAVMVVGISGLFQTTNKINKDVVIQETKAYNHSTENALDNVFIQDNNLILPFIFDNANQAETLNIRAQFAKANMTIKNISDEPTGTGTQITVNENTNTYNVVIYGDVNGDGKINLIDAQRVILNYLNPNTNALTGLNAIAANVNNKDNNDINLIDAQRIILFYLGNLNTGLVVEEPEASNPIDPTDPSDPTTRPIDPINKEITEINSDIYEVDRNCGEQVVFTLTSGKNEKNIDIKDLIFTINDSKGSKGQVHGKNIVIDGKEVGTIETMTGTNGAIKVYFIGKVADTYKIIPSVGNITGKEIVINVKEVEEDKSINKITLDTTNFVKDKEYTVGIHFWNENTEITEVDMSKVSVSIPPLEDIVDIEVDRINKTLLLTPKKEGEATLTISIEDEDNETYTESILIQVNEEGLVVDIGEEITLTKIQDDDDYNYVYIPIYKIDNNGIFDDEINKKISRLKVKDILYKTYKDEESERIEFVDNVIYKLGGPTDEIMSSIHINVYDKDKNDISRQPNADVFYVGISLESDAEPEVIDGNGYIVVKHGDKYIKRFNINVK